MRLSLSSRRRDTQETTALAMSSRRLNTDDEGWAQEKRMRFLWAASNSMLATAPSVAQQLSQTLLAIASDIAPAALKFFCPDCGTILVSDWTTRSRTVSSVRRRGRRRRGGPRRSFRDPAWQGRNKTAVARLCFLCSARWLESCTKRTSNDSSLSATRGRLDLSTGELRGAGSTKTPTQDPRDSTKKSVTTDRLVPSFWATPRPRERVDPREKKSTLSKSFLFVEENV